MSQLISNLSIIKKPLLSLTTLISTYTSLKLGINSGRTSNQSQAINQNLVVFWQANQSQSATELCCKEPVSYWALLQKFDYSLRPRCTKGWIPKQLFWVICQIFISSLAFQTVVAKLAWDDLIRGTLGHCLLCYISLIDTWLIDMHLWTFLH